MWLPQLTMILSYKSTSALRQGPKRSGEPLPVRYEAIGLVGGPRAFEEKGQAKRGLFSENAEARRREAPANVPAPAKRLLK